MDNPKILRTAGIARACGTGGPRWRAPAPHPVPDHPRIARCPAALPAPLTLSALVSAALLGAMLIGPLALAQGAGGPGQQGPVTLRADSLQVRPDLDAQAEGDRKSVV